MPEYINRELLLNDLETSIVVSGRNDIAPLELRGVHKVINRIKAMPTEDVVPVVRCKDCKHCRKDTYFDCCDKYSRPFDKLYVEKDHFCSYGERKADNG